MPGRALLVVVGSLLLLVTLLGAGGDVAVAAKVPVDLPVSLWATQGVLKLSIPGQTQLSIVPAIVGFGPQGSLDANEFGIAIDPADLDLIVLGTYLEKSPGKPVCTIDLQDLETKLQDQFQFTPEVIFTLRGATAKLKPRNKDGVETIRVLLNIKFRVCGVDDEGRFRCVNLGIQYKGLGGRGGG